MASSATPLLQDGTNDGPQPNNLMSSQTEAATMTGTETRLWDRAWTMEEMRKKAGNWKLAGDAGLLMYLQEFSQKMLSRTHEISKEVDSLMHEAKMTGVRVHTAFNDFIMLANTQFIENRVYDEDVSQEAQMAEEKKNEEHEKSREQRESELIPKVKQALQLGVNVIDEAFEHLDMNAGNSDTDDEETNRVGAILEAKDPYINRSLPHLIGSPNFMQDNSVGLMDDYSDQEEETDHGSISETESEESESDEFDKDIKKKPISSSESESEYDSESEGSESEEGDDLFGTERKPKVLVGSPSGESSEEEVEDECSEEDKGTKVSEPSGPTDFAAELAAKLGSPVAVAVTENKDEEEAEHKHREKRSASTIGESGKKKDRDKEKNKKKLHHEKKDDDDMFGTSVAPEGEEDAFGTTGGLFSSHKGLFDDDEEENGLFDDVEKSPKKEHKKAEAQKTRKKSESRKRSESGGSALFDDDEDFLGDGTGKFVKKEESKPEVKKKAVSGSLFDDKDDDDLFAPSTRKDTLRNDKGGTKPKSNLFEGNDENQDLFEEKEKEHAPPTNSKEKKKLPAGAVSLFGNVPNPMMAALHAQKEGSDEEEEQEASEGEKSRSGSIMSDRSSASAASLPRHVQSLKKSDHSPSQSSNSLFADDPDDALFTSPSKPQADSKPKPVPNKSLFDDGEQDEDLFAGMKSATVKSADVKPKAEKHKAKTLRLFDDDGDLFGSTSPKDSDINVGEIKKTEKKHSQAKITEPPKTISPRKKKSSLSLFGDEEDIADHEDLFGAVAAPMKTPLTSSENKSGNSKSLFDDEDILYGGAEDVPTVDLFGAQNPLAPKAEAEHSTEEESEEESPKHKKPVGGVSMFGGVDPFTAAKAKTSTKPPGSEKKEPAASKTEEEKPTSKQRIIDPLFGGNEEDEDDDMFAAPSKKVHPKPQKSEEVVKKPDLPAFLDSDQNMASDTKSEISPSLVEEKSVEPEPDRVDERHKKKPVGGVSLFGGVDPFPQLKDKKPILTEETNEVKQEEAHPKLTNNHPDQLFGGTEDGDDLFAAPVTRAKKSKEILEKPEIPAPIIKPEITQYVTEEKDEDKNITEEPTKHPPQKLNRKPPDSLFDNDMDNDILFGPPPLPDLDDLSPITDLPGTGDGISSMMESDENDGEPEPVPPKPKKPAGAVSMFGGLDPFVDLKGKQSTAKEETDESKMLDKETDSLDESVNRKIPKPTTGVTPRKIGTLKANIAINPAALLPGAIPPFKQPEPVAVHFDEPAETKTLESVHKDRAKIQTKRRPPSRRGRRPESAGDALSPSSLSSTSSEPESTRPSMPPSMSANILGNDDLLGDLTAKPSVIRVNEDTREKDIFSGDLFGKNLPNVNDDLFDSSRRTGSDETDNDIDIFSDVVNSVSSQNVEKSHRNNVPNEEEDVLSRKSKPSQKDLLKTVMNNNTDDIFVSIPDESKENEKSKNIEVSHTDEVTSSVENSLEITRKSKSKKSKEPGMVTGDDIFADSSLLKKGSLENSDVPRKPENETMATSPDEIVDTSTKKTKMNKKKAATRDEDLFKDETDIFANIPAPKPKEKKKKKVAASGKKIFKEDIDDIFADTVASTTVKPKNKKAVVQKVTLADDDTDIFDDPLNVVGI